MDIRKLALAGAAVVMLATPAAASYPGWYLGLAVGYDHLEPVHVNTISGPFNQGFQDNALYLAAVGYKFEDSGLRTELELGFDEHKVHNCCGGTGGASNSSAMVNLLYDINVGDGWVFNIGGGVGVADENAYVRYGSQLATGADLAFQWQAIGGVSYELTDDVDLFADYRFRSAEINSTYASPFYGVPVHVNQAQEHVGLLGIRWYLGWAPPPPPPPPPAPPEAPPPPPAVKTFIVFFDFDKSNLTAEAQSVVTEAVKTAKSSGFVKVIVTGHTDTVGSDSYNQGLSVRRAESVKDEMVRQGMDGGSIAIEGKSFHDPLVPTGPGVREPQNRRAVIDLG